MVLLNAFTICRVLYYIGHGRHKSEVWLQAADSGPGAFYKTCRGKKTYRKIVFNNYNVLFQAFKCSIENNNIEGIS